MLNVLEDKCDEGACCLAVYAPVISSRLHTNHISTLYGVEAGLGFSKFHGLMGLVGFWHVGIYEPPSRGALANRDSRVAGHAPQPVSKTIHV